jgi:hypothetical protein
MFFFKKKKKKLILIKKKKIFIFSYFLKEWKIIKNKTLTKKMKNYF